MPFLVINKKERSNLKQNKKLRQKIVKKQYKKIFVAFFCANCSVFCRIWFVLILQGMIELEVQEKTMMSQISRIFQKCLIWCLEEWAEWEVFFFWKIKILFYFLVLFLAFAILTFFILFIEGLFGGGGIGMQMGGGGGFVDIEELLMSGALDEEFDSDDRNLFCTIFN